MASSDASSVVKKKSEIRLMAVIVSILLLLFLSFGPQAASKGQLSESTHKL